MASGWRARLVGLFDPGDPVAIACDPARLILDEAVLASFATRGFRVVPYDDPIAFRLIYEEDFRCRWDREEDTPRLLVWVDHPNPEFLPWDVVEDAIVWSIDPADFFPAWPPALLKALDPRDWDLLEAVEGPGAKAPVTEAMHVLLRGIFHIDVTAVRTPEDVHWVFSRIHWAPRPIPPALLKALSQQITMTFDPQWFSRRDAWLSALFQELEQSDAPERLPFFSQIRRGMPSVPNNIQAAREPIERALAQEQEWRARDWLDLALSLGLLEHARITDNHSEWDGMLSHIEERFDHWIISHYGLLGSLPYWPNPVMVHQVLPWVQMKGWSRVALVVLDGLSTAEWPLVKAAMGREPDDEGAVFAWVPTLTSVSRQSLLGGRRPREFASKIFSTQGEKGLWERFWADQGLNPDMVWYGKHVDDQPVDHLLAELTVTKRAALIINRIDDLAHNATMGMAQLFQDVDFWLQKGWLRHVIQGLNERGFTVVVTSDHGHLDVVGTGAVPDPGLATTQGQRARIYQRPALLERVQAAGISWPYLEGLPENFYVLLASHRSAFVTPGEHLVSHGGAHWLEVLVPWGIWEA
ncbi:MAG: BREX-3 system phosphatase PglZ [Sulfobacillus sp.]|nr:BREX-3 system phosphatase PglZ [Sulfobacillus sp.]